MSRLTRRRQPQFDEKGLAPHGSPWDEGTVLRYRSRGPGVPVEIQAPLPGPVRRVLSGSAQVEVRGGKTYVTPSDEAGVENQAIVEY